MTDEAPDDTYEPSTVEVNRAREQGGGMGAKDLAYQRDATGPGRGGPSGLGSPSGGASTASEDQAGPPGKPDKAYGDRDADQVDVDFPGA